MQRLKAASAWIAFGLLLLVPVYAILTAFAIRSGVFDLKDRTIGDEEFKAVWAFIAAGLGTAATVLGLLLTKSHNDRTLAFQHDIENRKLIAQTEMEQQQARLKKESEMRLALDTVVSSLDLITLSNGEYAPRAKVAGALATLIRLEQPVIAMRTLSNLWDDGRIDEETACWLINEVFKGDSDESKEEAAWLLRKHVNDLCRGDDKKGYFAWPATLMAQWLLDLPLNARANNLYSAVSVLLSRDRVWWVNGYDWAFLLLDDALSRDDDTMIKDSTAELLTALLAVQATVDYSVITPSAGWKSMKDIQARTNQHSSVGRRFFYVTDIVARIEVWGKGKQA